MKSKTLAVAFALITMSLLPAVPGQQAGAPSASSPLPELYPSFFAKLKKGDYLGLLLDMRRNEAGYRADERQRGGFLELMSVINSQVGNYAEAHAYLDEFMSAQQGRDKDVDRAPFDGYEPRDAVEAIRAAAGSHQVVMINQEHDTPMHRAFTTRLLPVLYARGFRYFAAETLAEDAAELQRRGYPTLKTGFYTADPVYADLVRTAIRLGFKVVAYEYMPRDCQNPPDKPDFCQNERERGQASNLNERIFRADPKAKVLIHVGYGHNSEAARRGGGKLMAGYFKEFTGIDPLTVDQTVMSEHSAPDYEHPLYLYATSRGLVPRPVVFRNARGELFAAQKGARDITLFQPRSVYENGRPTWLGLDGARKPHRLPRDVCAQAARCLVSARAAGESADAAPVDRLEVSAAAAAPPPALLLPRGEFVVEAVDAEGKKVKEFRVKKR
ncbi:MAG TPA: hypothetical protein VM864_00805 [Pyrinomonadaceae bacterium]|jgi:hypothetical protein|nr:hypothetical protein [Pyrinomonadaceae bacterium]